MKDAGDNVHIAATGSETYEPFQHDMAYLLRRQGEYAREHWLSWVKGAGAIGGVVLGASLITAPVAKELAIEHATIETDVAEAPAEMHFTGNGTSSIQTGIFGNYYAPVNKDGIGITAEMKDIPGGGSRTIRDLFSPQFVDVLTNLYHEPQRSADVYADLLKDDARSKGNLFFGMGMLGLSALALGPLALRKDWQETIKQHQKTTAAIGVGVFAISLTLSNSSVEDMRADWAKDSPQAEKAYPIRGLDGTFLEGATAGNEALQLAANEAVPFFEKNRDRQEAATNEFVDTASRAILLQTDHMTGPREGEVADISIADVHSSQAMIRVMALLRDTWAQKWGNDAIKYITVSGDLTTNGAAVEGVFIEDLANVGEGPDDDAKDDDTDIVAISGDHETPVNVEQIVDAGMSNPNMDVETVNGTTFLGANDPAQKDVGGSKTDTPIGGVSEQELGQQVREIADEENPDVVLLHQGYAVQSFLGIGELMPDTTKGSITTFLRENGPGNIYQTRYRDDGIPNVPAKKIRFGHWHEEMPIRTIWNEEFTDSNTAVITWTTVEELNTAGGAIGNPTVNKFSLPWYPPLQDAVVRVNFSNAESGLTTGYQEYTFRPDGSLVIGHRVEIGLPGGQPGFAQLTRTGDGTLKLKKLILADEAPINLRRELVSRP